MVSCSSNVLLKCLNEDVPQSQTDPSESHGHTGSPNIVPTLWVLCHVPNLKDKFVMDQARILSKCQILACWGRGNLLWDMGSLAVLLCNPVHLSHPDPSSFLPNIQFTSLPGIPSRDFPSRLVLHHPSLAQGRDHLPSVGGGRGGHCDMEQ